MVLCFRLFVLYVLYVPFVFFVAEKKECEWTVMEPVYFGPPTLKTQGRSPLVRYQPCVYEEGL